jgi:hypothetical protein
MENWTLVTTLTGTDTTWTFRTASPGHWTRRARTGRSFYLFTVQCTIPNCLLLVCLWVAILMAFNKHFYFKASPDFFVITCCLQYFFFSGKLSAISPTTHLLNCIWQSGLRSRSRKAMWLCYKLNVRVLKIVTNCTSFLLFPIKFINNLNYWKSIALACKLFFVHV